MKKFLFIYLTFSSILHASENINIRCIKQFDNITNQSPIKESAPTSLDILIKRKFLNEFIWDGQRMDMHFEYKDDDNFDVKILSLGYSDIKNAVFFEIKNNHGYLYQYSQKGVNYLCRNL